jgi:hypothetical protein
LVFCAAFGNNAVLPELEPKASEHCKEGQPDAVAELEKATDKPGVYFSGVQPLEFAEPQLACGFSSTTAPGEAHRRTDTTEDDRKSQEIAVLTKPTGVEIANPNHELLLADKEDNFTETQCLSVGIGTEVSEETIAGDAKLPVVLVPIPEPEQELKDQYASDEFDDSRIGILIDSNDDTGNNVLDRTLCSDRSFILIHRFLSIPAGF